MTGGLVGLACRSLVNTHSNRKARPAIAGCKSVLRTSQANQSFHNILMGQKKNETFFFVQTPFGDILPYYLSISNACQIFSTTNYRLSWCYPWSTSVGLCIFELATFFKSTSHTLTESYSDIQSEGALFPLKLKQHP